MTTPHLDTFTRAYLECALWTSDPQPRPGEWCESDEWCIDRIDSLSLAQAIQDCAAFQDTCREALELVSSTYDATDEQHGHDFWLTRNHHGAGFWDRGYDDRLAELLTEAAHAYGEANISGPDTTDQGNSTPEMMSAWNGVIYID